MSNSTLIGKVRDVLGDLVTVSREDGGVRIAITGATSADIPPANVDDLLRILSTARDAARAWSDDHARNILADSIASGTPVAVDQDEDPDSPLAARPDLEAIARIQDQLDALAGESGAGVQYAEDALAYVAGQWGYRLVSRDEEEEDRVSFGPGLLAAGTNQQSEGMETDD